MRTVKEHDKCGFAKAVSLQATSIGKTKIVIDRVRPASQTEWDIAWEGYPYATFFHSRQWSELWCQYTAGKMKMKCEKVEFSDGQTAILPILKNRAYRGFASTSVFSAAGTYGGWISAGELGLRHAELLADRLLNKSSIYWRINPFDVNVRTLFNSDERRQGLITAADYTHVIDTSRGFDAIIASWTKNNFRAVRRGVRMGIEVRTASCESDWRDYFIIYRDALNRWGTKATSHYRWELFKYMYETGSPHIELRLAFLKGKPIGGMLCLKSLHHLSIWHAVAFTDFLYLRPFNTLLFSAIEDACQNGLTWFDFNPSGGHAGVALSKERFGATKLSCPEIAVKGKRYRLVEHCAEAVRIAKKKLADGSSHAV